MNRKKIVKIFRIAMGITYDGSSYYGWQKQAHLPSIQMYMEQAISCIANHKVNTVCSGRTDAGVHASGQVLHFDTHSFREDASWLSGCNRFLPKDIRVIWVKKVNNSFSARFSALERRYRYILYNSSISPGIMSSYMGSYPCVLNIDRMVIASKIFLGKHNFFSFQGCSSDYKNTIRTIRSISLQKRKNTIVFDVCANSFLLHMVRNIVGALVAVGEGRIGTLYLKHILIREEREKNYVTVSSKGLYLTSAIYPKIFNLPVSNVTPFFSI